MTNTTKPQPSRLSASQGFNDPRRLLRIGPIIKAAWHVDPLAQQKLATAGLPIPSPARGYLLIDTGAGETAIDADVAAELGLQPVGRQQVHGMTGWSTTNRVKAWLEIFVDDIRGEIQKVALSVDFICTPNIRAAHASYREEGADGTPVQIIGLLGRDVLSRCKLTYNGLEGNWYLEIDESIVPRPG